MSSMTLYAYVDERVLHHRVNTSKSVHMCVLHSLTTQKAHAGSAVGPGKGPLHWIVMWSLWPAVF